jgi:hypothetical protein
MWSGSAQPAERNVALLRLSCLVIAALAFACTNASTNTPALPAVPEQPSVRREPWARFAEVMSWEVVSGPLPAQGHFTRHDRIAVRVSPDARDAYLAWVTDSSVPNGSVVAAFHTSAAGETGPSYVMLKEAFTWQYLVLGAQGVLVEERPRGCDGCHADAVADRLFGPPRPRATP